MIAVKEVMITNSHVPQQQHITFTLIIQRKEFLETENYPHEYTKFCKREVSQSVSS